MYDNILVFTCKTEDYELQICFITLHAGVYMFTYNAISTATGTSLSPAVALALLTVSSQ